MNGLSGLNAHSASSHPSSSLNSRGWSLTNNQPLMVSNAQLTSSLREAVQSQSVKRKSILSMLLDFQLEVKVVCLAVQVDQLNVMLVPMIQLRMQQHTASILILKLWDAVMEDQKATLTIILSTTSRIVHSQRSSKIWMLNSKSWQVLKDQVVKFKEVLSVAQLSGIMLIRSVKNAWTPGLVVWLELAKMEISKNITWPALTQL